MGICDMLHGYPRDKIEVAMAKSTLHLSLGLGLGPRIWKGKRKIWAFSLKPKIRVS